MKESIKNLDNIGSYLSTYKQFLGERNKIDVKIQQLIDTDYHDISLKLKTKTKFFTSYYFEFPKYTELFTNNLIIIDNVDDVIMGDGTSGNRIHIEDIGSKLKGLGLAYKIYQKAIDTFGYISTDAQSTSKVKNMWRKLVQNDDYIVLIYKGHINLKYCANCVDTPEKITCPNCNGRESIKCDYCKNIRTVPCRHTFEKKEIELVYISKSNDIINNIKNGLLKSGMIDKKGITIY